MMAHRFAVSLAVVLALSSIGKGQEASNPTSTITLEDIVTGLERNEQAIKTLSVTMRAKQQTDLGLLFGRKTDSIRSSFTETWHIDNSMRGWNEANGETITTKPDGRVTTKRFESRSVNDGKRASQLTTEWTGRRNASVRGSVGPTFGRYAIAPIDFTIGHQDDMISPSLRENGARIVREDTWDGHDVIVAETATAVNESQYKSQYWIDPQRNFLVVRRQNMSRANDEAPWHAFYSVDSFKHKEVADGIWLPTIAWRRSYGPATNENPRGEIHRRCDVMCVDWKVNEPLDVSKLQLTFPAGVKVHGLERKQAEGFVKSKSFFVLPIETELQRLLLRDKNSTTYANIDATAIADVNTRLIDPANFDLEALRSELQRAAKGSENPRLKLHIDFGSLGTDQDFLRFVKAPLKDIAENAGFKDIRLYETYNGSRIWHAPDDANTVDVSEDDLGDDHWQVFAVGTPLSQYFANDSDYLIASKFGLEKDAKRLLSDEAIKSIRTAIKGQAIDGKRLEIKIRIGGNREDPNAFEESALVKQGSKEQRNCIDQLRGLGFGDIQLVVQIGYRNWVSTYRK